MSNITGYVVTMEQYVLFPLSDVGDAFGTEEALSKEEVMDWIRKCLEDYPLISDFKPYQQDIYVIHEARKKWFERWFAQFGELFKDD